MTLLRWKMTEKAVLKAAYIEVTMQFDPAIHTREFLLKNVDTAIRLAESSSEFSKSSLSNDYSILKLTHWEGDTVAHKLAQHQPAWIHSDAVKSRDVLQIIGKHNAPVAHVLAQYQPEWIHSEEAKDRSVLQLTCEYGESVAHILAMYQPLWIHSAEAADKQILTLKDHDGWSVANTCASYQRQWLHSEAAKDQGILLLSSNNGYPVADELIKYSECVNHDPLFSKKILTTSVNGKLIAEKIVAKYSGKISLDTMIMKLISQGAAYIHSTPMNSAIAYKVLNQTKKLVEDCFNQEVKFRYSHALYSTFFHNIERLKSNNVPLTSNTWPNLLSTAEQMMKNILLENPEFYDADILPDIYCEPAADALNRLKAERCLSSTNIIDLSLKENSDELNAKNALY